MTITDIILLVLGTWGAVWLLVFGVGPAAILSRFRQWVGVRYDVDGHRYGLNWIGDLFNCPICLSLWVAPVVLIILLVWWYAVAVLAALGVVSIIAQLDWE